MTKDKIEFLPTALNINTDSEKIVDKINEIIERVNGGE